MLLVRHDVCDFRFHMQWSPGGVKLTNPVIHTFMLLPSCCSWCLASVGVVIWWRTPWANGQGHSVWKFNYLFNSQCGNIMWFFCDFFSVWRPVSCSHTSNIHPTDLKKKRAYINGIAALVPSVLRTSRSNMLTERPLTAPRSQPATIGTILLLLYQNWSDPYKQKVRSDGVATLVPEMMHTRALRLHLIACRSKFQELSIPLRLPQ
jgi:hypothetical protein